MTQIVTNPGRGEALTTEDRNASIPMRNYLDDITLKLNGNLLGDSIKTAIYDVTNLPLPQDNRGGMIFVTNILSFQNIPVPCWAANPEPPFILFTIDNVTNVGGIAQFNHTGNSVVVGERVNISGFVTNLTYNVTETKVTSSTASSFQISSITFTGSELTGKYSRGSNWRELLQASIIG